METKFQTTSFIPKASLDNVVDDKGNDFFAETSKPLTIGKKPV